MEEYVQAWARTGFATPTDERMWRGWETLVESTPALPFLVGLDHLMI
jgi:hypothetical protein